MLLPNLHPKQILRIPVFSTVQILLALQFLAIGCTQADSDFANSSTASDTETTQIPATSSRSSTSFSATSATSIESQQVASDQFRTEGLYSVMETDPTRVRLVWLDQDNRPLGQLERARQQVDQSGVEVLAVLNAGIYTPDQAPAGLHIQDGIELVPINLNSGEGNFHLRPNGVFYVEDGRAKVQESEAFDQSRRNQGVAPTLAVQSGPLLLEDGQIHPEFSASSESRFLRNGVGVTPEGNVLFLNANQPVTFWEFATEFLNRGAINALYLDGSISRMEPVVPGQTVPLNIPFAGMLVVTE